MRRLPSTRVLAAACLALVVLVAAMALIERGAPVEALRTPIGTVPLPELAALALAMMLGGFVARTGFRTIAVVLTVAAGVASMVATTLITPTDVSSTVAWLARNHALVFALELLVAWLAAATGERLSQLRGARMRRGD